LLLILIFLSQNPNPSPDFSKDWKKRHIWFPSLGKVEEAAVASLRFGGWKAAAPS
jgi:hypothetical protein